MTGGPALATGGVAARAPARFLAQVPNGPSSPQAARAAAPRFCLTAVAGDTQVQLRWFPFAPGENLAIHYGTVQDVRAGKFSVATSALVDNLKNRITYDFWLVADGEDSNAVSNMVSATPSATPLAPTWFCLTAVAGDTQVHLKWFPSAPGKGFAIYGGTEPDSNTAGKIEAATGTSALVDKLADGTALVNGTTYDFWLVGEGDGLQAADGTGPNVVSNMASATPAAMPGAPAGLTATPGDLQVTLSWAAPASDGGAPISGYDVYQGTSPGGETGTPVRGSPFTATSTTVTGLVNGTTYYFKVAAVNAAGRSPLSAEASAVPVTRPDPPAGLTATPGDLQVTLSWAAPASDGGAPISGYDVYQGTSPGGETGTPVSGSPFTATSTTVTGLANGTTYYFKVAAVNGVGEGPASAEVSATPAAMPGAPAGLTATAGNAQVTLSWTAPASNGGLPVTGYHLYAGTTADFSGKSPLATLTGTVVTVAGLANGTTYYFKVAAINRVGEGPGTDTEAVPVTTPGAPTGLTATPGDSQVTLSWTAPASDGGAPISEYIVYQGTSPGGETSAAVSGSPVTATSTTVTGLVNGTDLLLQGGRGQCRRSEPSVSRGVGHRDAVPRDHIIQHRLGVGQYPSPGVRRTDGADRDRGQHPSPPVLGGASTGRRAPGQRLQGLLRHHPRHAARQVAWHLQGHWRHHGGSGQRHRLLLQSDRGQRRRERKPGFYRGISRADRAGLRGHREPELADGVEPPDRFADGRRGPDCRRRFHAYHAPQTALALTGSG